MSEGTLFHVARQRVHYLTLHDIWCHTLSLRLISVLFLLHDLTLLLPEAVIIGFCKQHRSRWDGSMSRLIWIYAVWHSVYQLSVRKFRVYLKYLHTLTPVQIWTYPFYSLLMCLKLLKKGISVTLIRLRPGMGRGSAGGGGGLGWGMEGACWSARYRCLNNAEFP